MRHWHRQFLGRTQLPPTLSALAISEFFTLDSGEAQAVLSRYGLDMRLGTALQIGFLKMCGRPLDKLQRVPAAVLEHLSPQLGGPSPDIATLRAIYVKRPRTLYQHQQFALDTLGMMRFDFTADAPRVMTALCDEVRAGVERDKLLAQVREDGMTQLEFLQEPAGLLRPSSILRQSERVRALTEMKISEMPSLPGTERYWQMYALRMRHQRPSRFAQRAEPRRSIELVGFLRHTLAAHTDTLIRMVDRRVSQLWGRASQQAKADQGALPTLTVLLAGLRESIASERQTKAQRFDAIVKLIERYDAGELKPQSIAARQRTILVEEIQQIRPLLKSLVGLDLHADEASHWPALISAWKDAYERGSAGLTTPMAPPKSQAWKSLALDEPAANQRHAAEAQLLWELRQALRPRTVHVPSSLSYQSRATMLDSGGSTVTAARSDYPVKSMLKELLGVRAYQFQRRARLPLRALPCTATCAAPRISGSPERQALKWNWQCRLYPDRI